MKRRNFIVGAIGTSLVTSTASQAAEDNALAPQQRPFIDHGDSVKTAPFGNNISPAITYYNRVSPYVATAGLLEEGGLEEAQKHGFKLLVDLRQPDENGVEAEMKQAAKLGLEYISIPVASGAPDWDQVHALAALLNEPEHYPCLVHCVSANRAGAIWALYRGRLGVPKEIAIQEGRAAGLESREEAVRKRMGL